MAGTAEGGVGGPGGGGWGGDLDCVRRQGAMSVAHG